ncbi:MAG TPA: VOC family protein [Minicystis sp.]|nr:VOC family protein [Minicystis sp.]
MAHAFTFTGIDHVQVAAPPGGEPAARAFYGELLGMAELAKPAALAARGGCWFSCGEAQIHVGVEKDFRAAKKAHPAIRLARAADLAALRARLEAAGAPVRDDGEVVPGLVRFFGEDPFGNRLEFVAPAGD